MILCATTRALLCEGRPVRPFQHCGDGLFLHLGPVAVGPQCFLNGDAFAAEVLKRREFLAFVHPLRSRAEGAAFNPGPDEMGLSTVNRTIPGPAREHREPQELDAP
jgi:hypothetical protein